MSAFDEQIGGNHYKNFAIQPTEFIEKNKLSFLEGCVVKRICRWRKKNGIEDLRKIQHEIDMLIELHFTEEEVECPSGHGKVMKYVYDEEAG